MQLLKFRNKDNFSGSRRREDIVVFKTAKQCHDKRQRENLETDNRKSKPVRACGVANRTVDEVKVKFKALKRANWTNPPNARRATGGGCNNIAAPYEDLMDQIIGDGSALRNGLQVQVQGVETGFIDGNGTVQLELEVHHSTPRKTSLGFSSNVNVVNGVDSDGEITAILGPDGETEIPVFYKHVSDSGTTNGSHAPQDQSLNQQAIKDSQLEFQTLSSGLQAGNGKESNLCADQAVTAPSIISVDPEPSAPQGSGFMPWLGRRQGCRRMPVRKRRLPAESSGNEEYNKILKRWADSTIRLQEEQLKLTRQQRLQTTLEILKMKKDLGLEVTQESMAAVLKEFD